MKRIIGGLVVVAVVLLALWWFTGRSEAPAPQAPSPSQVQTAPQGQVLAQPGQTSPEREPSRETPQVESPMQEQEGVLELTVRGQPAPVPGAAVSLFFRSAEDPSTHEPVWRLAARGDTDAQGRLRLPARPGSYLVRAAASGFGVGTLAVRRPAGEAVTQATITLTAPLHLEGRVVEKEFGNGLAGAELQLTRGGSFRLRAEAPSELRHTTRADVNGQFRFEQLEPGSYELIATAPSRAPKRLVDVQVPGVKPVLVELASSAYIEGYVLNASGGGEGEALVVAAGGEEPLQVTSGASGSFSLEVTPGVLYLSARKGALTGRLPRPLTVAAGATLKDIKLVLSDACQLSGVVRRKSDGLPVPGATVDLTPHGAVGSSGHAVTGAEGQYRLEAPCGVQDVTVRAPGHSERSQKGLVLRNSERPERDFELEEFGTITGKVQRASGEPVAGARISFGAHPGFPSDAVAPALSGADGTYTLEEVPPGEGVVEARTPGFDSGPSQRVKVPGGGVVRADFSAPAEAVQLKGRVLEASGELVGKSVELSAVTPGLASRTQSAADGTFELSLPPGDWKVMAFDGSRESKQVQVSLKPPGPVEVVLPLESLGEGIAVRVVEPDGTPSPKAQVVFRGGPKKQIFFGLYGDEEGSGLYNPKLWPPPSERFTAVAYQGLRTGSVETDVKAAAIVVTLAAPASIEGQVRSASSKPITRFTVTVPINEWMGTEQFEFSGDRFVIDEVPAGKWKLRAVTPDGNSAEKEVEAVPGRRTQVVLEFQKGASIRLRAVDAATGTPVPGWAQLDGGAEYRETVEGIVSWSDVAPGRHHLRVGGGLRQPVERDIEVKVGQQLELGDIALAAGEKPGGLGARFVWAQSGVEVSWVLPEGPAQQAGVKPGDIVLACDQRAILSLAELEPFEQGAPGAPVKLQLRRGPQTIELTVMRAK